MGITEQGLEFLLTARSSGVSFERTMTIGRQWLLVAPDRLAVMLGDPRTRAGLRGDPGIVVEKRDRFAEALFRYLGGQEVSSIDASDYEGATYCHDFNEVLPEGLARRFSAVVDGGALEHIFNFPTAMKNCMEMVEMGGHLLCMTPTNNAPGHGFYQFSPELYFRIFSPDNGFVLERMLLAEVHAGAIWYRVLDPAVVGERIEFATRRPAYLYAQARRVTDAPSLDTAPVQSDYSRAWQQLAPDESIDQLQPESMIPTPERRPRVVDRTVTMLKEGARRHPVIIVPIRALRRTSGRYRQYRHPYNSDHFQPLGPTLLPGTS